MSIRMFSPAETERALELARSDLRPVSIVTARAAYEAHLKEALAREASGEAVPYAEIQCLVRERLAIDALYTAWIEGRYADEELVPDPYR